MPHSPRGGEQGLFCVFSSPQDLQALSLGTARPLLNLVLGPWTSAVQN